MPKYYSTLNLPGFSITKTSGCGSLIAHVHYNKKPRCIHCKSDNLRLKEHSAMNQWACRQVTPKLSVGKYYCRACGKYLRQRFPGIIGNCY